MTPETNKTAMTPETNETAMTPETDEVAMTPETDEVAMTPETNETAMTPATDKVATAEGTEATERANKRLYEFLASYPLPEKATEEYYRVLSGMERGEIRTGREVDRALSSEIRLGAEAMGKLLAATEERGLIKQVGGKRKKYERVI
jgi:hypothetical protein